MSMVFFILMVAAMLAVLGALGTGLFYMSRQDEDSRAKSNKWMQIRVMLQGLALLFFALAALTAHR